MKSVQFSAIVLLLLVSTVSCSDDDTTAPVISITSPVENAIYTAGQTIPLKGTVTDETELKEVRIQNTAQVIDDKLKFVIDAEITNPDTIAPGNYVMQISAKDASGNSTEKTINFEIVK
ncbi:MAG: DUF4625 domain-containing protein [Saprospiraceae bacterium]